jgi:membrane protein implicated in regulation of membrane protease activity
METWIFWLILLITFIIVELATYWLTTFCLAVGCLAALIACLAGANLTWQICLLAVVALVTFVVAGPYFRRRYAKGADKAKKLSNMDALIGRKATVVQDISKDHPGRVKIDGDNWLAVSLDSDADIATGTIVEIEGYDSIILTVTPAQ